MYSWKFKTIITNYCWKPIWFTTKWLYVLHEAKDNVEIDDFTFLVDGPKKCDTRNVVFKPGEKRTQ